MRVLLVFLTIRTHWLHCSFRTRGGALETRDKRSGKIYIKTRRKRYNRDIYYKHLELSKIKNTRL